MARDLVFFSYSHSDKKWLTKIQKGLRPAIKKGLVCTWADTDIEPGKKWKVEIAKALADARVAVLIVSMDFLASDFIANNELPEILRSAEQDGLIILWVYAGACMYKVTEIADYDAAHDISRPLKSLTPAKQDFAIIDICEEIVAAYSGKNKKREKDLFRVANISAALPPIVER